jgi:hypothetical protein
VIAPIGGRRGQQAQQLGVVVDDENCAGRVHM